MSTKIGADDCQETSNYKYPGRRDRNPSTFVKFVSKFKSAAVIYISLCNPHNHIWYLSDVLSRQFYGTHIDPLIECHTGERINQNHTHNIFIKKFKSVILTQRADPPNRP